MRRFAGLTCLLLAACVPLARAQNAGTCAAPFTAAASPGMTLEIDARSGEIDVTGTDQAELSIACTLRDDDRKGEIHYRYQRSGSTGQLAIHGGPDNDVHIDISVPRHTNLRLRVPAGLIKIEDVTGDKDIGLHAGELIVSGVNPDKYRVIHASVAIGEVRAEQFGADNGGFFRSIEHTSPDGLYRLEAHVATGSIELR